jgi:hypothetical protein
VNDDTLVIPAAFNGPPKSGNGGWVGGRLAQSFAAAFGPVPAVEITFRAPSPLETRMPVVHRGDALRVMHGDTLVCEARAGTVAHLTPPPPPRNWAEVLRCNETGGSGSDSEFHTCLVCGRHRAVGDGLRVFGGSTSRGASLSCYLPHGNHADASGVIRPEFVWGTLDCPGAWAAQDPEDPRPALTGRMTASIIAPPKVGERCAVVGWKTGEEGRKLYSGTALYTESGRLCALATCTWIVLKE